MKAALLQMVSTTDVATNLDTAERLLAQAAHAGAELAVLPEYFCLLGQQDADKLAIAEAYGDGPMQHESRHRVDCTVVTSRGTRPSHPRQVDR